MSDDLLNDDIYDDDDTKEVSLDSEKYIKELKERQKYIRDNGIFKLENLFKEVDESFVRNRLESIKKCESCYYDQVFKELNELITSLQNVKMKAECNSCYCNSIFKELNAFNNKSYEL